MRLTIVVKPNSRRESVETAPNGELRVAVNAPAQEGKANDAVVRALAEHFGVPRGSVRITHGHKGKRKLVEIDGR